MYSLDKKKDKKYGNTIHIFSNNNKNIMYIVFRKYKNII